MMISTTTSIISQPVMDNHIGILITNPIHSTKDISKNNHCPDNYRPLPSVLTGKLEIKNRRDFFFQAHVYQFQSLDFFAFKLCDFIQTRPLPIGSKRTAPELVYFILKITSQARISCHIAVVALIYIERCKAALPKNAIGDQGMCYEPSKSNDTYRNV